MIRVFFALLVMLQLVASATVTIEENPAFQSQRPCARGCFMRFGAAVYAVADAIGCEPNDPQNECVCRPDLQAGADVYIKSCVNNNCGKNTLDVNSAVSIYDSYCTSAGFLRETTVPATTTSGTDNSPSTVTVTMLQTVTVSSAQKRLKSPLEVLVENLAGFRR
jgi:hypothetical protein